MEFRPNLQKYQYQIKSIDSHTMGEATRIVYDGFPGAFRRHNDGKKETADRKV